MEPRGKFSFQMIGGALTRGCIRRELARLVSDLHYHYPDSQCSIQEAKGFLESTFFFVGHNVPKSAIVEVDRAISKWVQDAKGERNAS